MFFILHNINTFVNFTQQKIQFLNKRKMIQAISQLHPVAQVVSIIGIACFACIAVYYWIKFLNDSLNGK